MHGPPNSHPPPPPSPALKAEIWWIRWNSAQNSRSWWYFVWPICISLIWSHDKEDESSLSSAASVSAFAGGSLHRVQNTQYRSAPVPREAFCLISLFIYMFFLFVSEQKILTGEMCACVLDFMVGCSFLAVDMVFRFQSFDPCDVELMEHLQLSRPARAAFAPPS